MTRHDRYFKKVVILLGVIFFLIAGYHLNAYYKDRAEKVGAVLKQVELYRQKAALIPAIHYIKQQEEAVFWRSWPFFEKQAYALEAPLFYEFSRRFAQKGEEEEALFWLYLARFYLSYDALRCQEKALATQWRLWMDKKYSAPIVEYLSEEAKTQTQESILARVLDFDAKYKRSASAAYLCAYVQQPFWKMPAFAARDTWPSIKSMLRASAATLIEKQ